MEGERERERERERKKGTKGERKREKEILHDAMVMIIKGALQLQIRCRVLDAKLSRCVREELQRSLRLKEATKPS